MAGLRGFASHGGSILSRGWLATVETLGYPRHPPSTLVRQLVKSKNNGFEIVVFVFQNQVHMFMDPFQTDPAAEIDRQWYVECKVNLTVNLWCILIPGIQM